MLDLASNTFIATITVGSSPNGIAMTPDGTRIYAPNRSSANVSVIDTATNTVIATIPAGTLPVNAAVTPNGSRVYVSNSSSNNVTVIDTATNTVVTTIPVGTGPNGIGVTSDGTQVYVSNFNSATISRIDTATNTVIGSIPFTGTPYQMNMGVSGRAYVGAFNGAAIRVVDTTTNSILTSIPGFSFPVGIVSGLVPASTGAANLSIGVSDSPDPVTAGENVLYAVTVTNSGPNPATNVIVNDSLPAGMTFLSAAGPVVCTNASNVLTCALGTLASGSNTTFHLSVRADTPGVRSNTVHVNGAERDPQPSNNAASTSTTVNGVAPATYTVTTIGDAGVGSLRQAIFDANANLGQQDTIRFNITGAGPHTITPTTALPTITEAVLIDGTTQANFAGQPLIELNGTSAGASANGLLITGNNVTVRALAINRFANYGINIQGSNNRLQGNYIGVDPTGTVARPNLHGIAVQNGSLSNLVGGTGPGEGNVVSGNSQFGIFVLGVTLTSIGNRLEGNFIGTNASGTTAIPNGTVGIGIFAGSTGTRSRRLNGGWQRHLWKCRGRHQHHKRHKRERYSRQPNRLGRDRQRSTAKHRRRHLHRLRHRQ